MMRKDEMFLCSWVETDIKKPPFQAVFLERVKGIEPSYSAWEAAALPLSYTRNLYYLSINSLKLCVDNSCSN